MEDTNSRRENLSPAKRALLEQRLRGMSPVAAQRPEVIRKPPEIPASLSYAQERIWFVSQLSPNSPAYNMHEAVRIRGPLDLRALTGSLNELISRHPILRTAFSSGGRQTQQVVGPVLELAIQVYDLTAFSGGERQNRLQQIALAEAQHPFNLSALPLLRLSVAQLQSEESILFLTVHHIISDEWSNKIFWNELAELYAAHLSGSPARLPDLPVQYVDFAYWQRQWLAGGAMQTHLDFWRKQLTPPLPVLQLPADHPRPAVQRYRGAIHSATLPAPTLQKLRVLSQQSGATLFMTLLAHYFTLLYRYSGQGDLLVGTPIANRSRPEFENLLGVFLNTLAIRVNLEDDPTFSALLDRVRQAALAAFSHSDLPFERLVEELQPERDLSYHPLFQVMFVYLSQPALFELPGLVVEAFPVDGGVSKFDLTLFAVETGDVLELFLEYNTDLFDAATVSRLLTHFQVLIEGVLSDPDRPVSTLPILTPEERHQFLVSWNATAVDYPREMSIHALIEHWADQTPDAPALLFRGQALSYRELDERANRLAHALRAEGVQPGSLVGLCVERSFEMLVGILGILKAGAAYVPVDPGYPPERLVYLLEDSSARVLVTQDRFAGLFAGQNLRLVLVDGEDSRLAGYPETRLALPIRPESLAYVIYTSGSTGAPKGVPVTHRQLVHSTTARLTYYPEPVERFLLLSSFAFDSSVAGIFGALAQGGTLCLPEQQQEQDVNAIAGLVARYRVTHVLCLPSLYNLLLEFTGHHLLTTLKVVIVAGEACPVSLVRRHSESLPEAVLYNEYGPTEGTVWCSVYRIPGELSGHSVPIGRPVPNMQLYILDRHLQPVPIGVSGELYIGGEGVVAGYLNRPDLTAARFLEQDWGDGGPVRLYRTGDLARYLPDGNVEFLGRTDNQVKIRGFRIELEEIEAVLNHHPQVQQSVVVARPERASSQPTGSAHRVDAGALADRLLELEDRTAERILREIEALPEDQVDWLVPSEVGLQKDMNGQDRYDA